MYAPSVVFLIGWASERGSVKFHSGGQIRGIIDHVRNKKGWNLSEGNRMERCGRMKTDYKEDLILYSHMVAIVVCEIFSCQCRRPKETKREKLKRILFRFKGLQLNAWFHLALKLLKDMSEGVCRLSTWERQYVLVITLQAYNEVWHSIYFIAACLQCLMFDARDHSGVLDFLSCCCSVQATLNCNL